MEKLEREKEEAEKEKARPQYSNIVPWFCPSHPPSLECKKFAQMLNKCRASYYNAVLTYCME